MEPAPDRDPPPPSSDLEFGGHAQPEADLTPAEAKEQYPRVLGGILVDFLGQRVNVTWTSDPTAALCVGAVVLVLGAACWALVSITLGVTVMTLGALLLAAHYWITRKR